MGVGFIALNVGQHYRETARGGIDQVTLSLGLLAGIRKGLQRDQIRDIWPGLWQ
jgi:hypothetical protein